MIGGGAPSGAGMISRGPRLRRMIGLGLLLLVASSHGASTDPRSVGAPPEPPAQAAERNDTPSVAQRCLHVVRRGDSLDRIAARYRTTRRALTTANDLASPNALLVGQRLQLPRCAPESRVSAMTSSSEAIRDAFSTHKGTGRVVSRQTGSVKSGPERLAFSWPVEGRVLSGFGRRGFLGWHRGLDIKAHPGQTICAAAPGTVVFSGWQSSYGRVVKIAHSNGFTTLYAHNVRNVVRAGDRVETGTRIAAVGRTGRATTDHLHFEIRRHGQSQDPLLLLARREQAPLLAKSD